MMEFPPVSVSSSLCVLKSLKRLRLIHIITQSLSRTLALSFVLLITTFKNDNRNEAPSQRVTEGNEEEKGVVV